jgi:hypothetical protein
MNNGRAVWHNLLNLRPAFLGEGPQPLLRVGLRAALVKITISEIPNRLNFYAISVYPHICNFQMWSRTAGWNSRATCSQCLALSAGLRRDVRGVALLACYAVCVDGCLPTLRDSVGCPETSVSIYQSARRSSPEEIRTQCLVIVT